MCKKCKEFSILFSFQDPFELNLNVTKGFQKIALDNWKKHCQATYEITTKLLGLHHSKDESPTSETDQENVGILAIFNANIEPVKKESKFEKKLKQKIEKSAIEKTGEGYKFTFSNFHNQDLDKTAYLADIKGLLKRILKVTSVLT
jgi:hypothetical protein